MESVSIAVKLDIGKETARSILKMSRRLKQLEHQFQGLHTRRNLAKGDLDQRVGNGARVAALAVGTYVLSLPRTIPSKSVQKTPHEMWTGRRPNMSFMKIWGCKAYVKHQMSTKLEPKSEKCTFVGYPKETKGYYFYNDNKVFVARTGVFLEKEFLTNSGKGRNIELEEVQQQQVIEPEVERISQAVEENPTDLETQPLHRSTRERHEPERYGFLVTTHGDVILVDQDEPKTYQEAVASPDSEKWLEAMRSEMDSMSEKPIAVFHDYEIWQMDVKTAFLNGKLEEDVYMTQP
ncbi:hypothetical protein V6N11_001203 [Hibiscus sabdariffa]|uniref:Retroviral polymerase SH3-like domain-containing protein n=1 Tax=Hibiscus sabdariffa TaxID=183260 RepID=A0ABR2RZB4_9ROSI